MDVENKVKSSLISFSLNSTPNKNVENVTAYSYMIITIKITTPITITA